MKFGLFVLLLIVSHFVPFAQNTSILSYNLGDTGIVIRKGCYTPCTSSVLFLNLHDDEKTSVQAAEAYLAEGGGTLVNIENNGKRIISFNSKGKTYSFDPNRVYSLSGTKATVKLLSGNYDASAGNQVSDFAKQLLTTFIDSSRLIIALHNNKNDGLSVLSYQKDQTLKKHSGSVFVSPDMDPDDFILTTDTSFFRRIKEKNVNVIFENSDSTQDDGSLSIYSGRINIPYINIEAEHGHFLEQYAMLLAIDEIIKEYRLEHPRQALASPDTETRL